MRSRGLTNVDVVVLGCVLLVISLFVAAAERPNYDRHARRANLAKCTNNLKQIALAAIQYSDDHHYFPHVGPLEKLDGGYMSSTATRVLRALTYFNYDDNPEGFVCPESVDQFNPLTAAAKADLRAFRWEGASGPPAQVSPLAPDGADAHDVPLDRSTEVSYGWTRKAYSSNASSHALLAADKSILQEEHVPTADGTWSAAHRDNMVGNHKDSLIAACLDGHTTRISSSDSSAINTLTISKADPADKFSGYLGVLGDDPSLGQ